MWRSLLPNTYISGKTFRVSDTNGRIQQFNIVQNLPEHRETDHRVLRLEQDFLRSADAGSSDENMMSTAIMNSVQLTETLHPADQGDESPLFNQAKRDELDGLVKRGAFEVVPKSSVFLGQTFSLETSCSQSRMWIRRLPCTKLFFFIVQGHRERDKHLLVQNSSIAQPVSVRLLVRIAAMRRYTLW